MRSRTPLMDIRMLDRRKRLIELKSRYLLATVLVAALVLLALSTMTKPAPIIIEETTTIPPEDWIVYSESVKEQLRFIKQNSGRHISQQNNTNFLAPLIPLKAIYRIAPEYALASCEIEKSMATLMVGVMCYLFDTDHFEHNNRTIESEWWDTRFCEGQNEVLETKDMPRYIPGPLLTLYIVRDPIERFVSGFIDKCINELWVWPEHCYNCTSDLDCVIRGAHKELSDLAAGRVEIPIHPKEPTYESRHFAPQTWYCNLADRFEDYAFVKYGNFGEEKGEMINNIGDILRRQGVPEFKVETVQESIGGGNLTRHATHGSGLPEKYLKMIMEDRNRVQLLMEIYETDYSIFGFTRPDVLLN